MSNAAGYSTDSLSKIHVQGTDIGKGYFDRLKTIFWLNMFYSDGKKTMEINIYVSIKQNTY